MGGDFNSVLAKHGALVEWAAKKLTRKYRWAANYFDDVRQCCLIALDAAARNHDPDRGAFGNYFYHCAEHEMGKYFRMRRSPTGDLRPHCPQPDVERMAEMRFEDGSPDLEANTPDPSQEVEDGEDRERVRAALAQLPERERLILLRMYFEGAGLDQLATEQHVSRQRIDQLRDRALAKMKSILVGEKPRVRGRPARPPAGKRALK